MGKSKEKKYIVYDITALSGHTDDANIFGVFDSEEEAREQIEQGLGEVIYSYDVADNNTGDLINEQLVWWLES